MASPSTIGGPRWRQMGLGYTGSFCSSWRSQCSYLQSGWQIPGFSTSEWQHLRFRPYDRPGALAAKSRSTLDGISDGCYPSSVKHDCRCNMVICGRRLQILQHRVAGLFDGRSESPGDERLNGIGLAIRRIVDLRRMCDDSGEIGMAHREEKWSWAGPAPWPFVRPS